MKKPDIVQPLPALPLETIRRRIIFRVAMGFVIVLLMIWLSSLLDIKHLLFGVPSRHYVWPENVLETILIIILAIIVFSNISHVLHRLRYLRGFLPVCASCKKIRLDDKWIPIEKYIQDRTEAQFSHGMCPECMVKFYPDLYKKK